MSKKRILIVDDDEALSRLTKAALDETDLYEVRVVNNPRPAKAAALEFMPDLILMDVIMPEMDGGSVAAAMREDERLRKTPIVFLTSILGKDEAASHGGMIGRERVIAKPLTIPELLDAVRKNIA